MVRKILLTLIALLGGGILLSQAQSKQISGTVTGSDGKPIAGVTVVVEGTSVGTTTNAAGAYSISARNDAKLVFSFIGMENQTIPVNGKNVVNVQMKEDAIGVDEVVVTAMGITVPKSRSATRCPPSNRTKSTKPAKATCSTHWPVKSPV